MEHQEWEQIEEDVLITCDRQSLQSIRQALSRQGILLSDETDTISENTLNGGQPLLDLVEFYALSVSATEVGFAIADSIKVARPYTNIGVPKAGELKDSSEKSW